MNRRWTPPLPWTLRRWAENSLNVYISKASGSLWKTIPSGNIQKICLLKEQRIRIASFLKKMLQEKGGQQENVCFVELREMQRRSWSTKMRCTEHFPQALSLCAQRMQLHK